MLNLLLFHWLKILYFFEALLVVGAILFGASEVQTFGLKLLGVTLAANIAVLLLRDYMRLRRRWQHSLVFVLAAVVLGLSLMGAVNLYRLGLHGMLAHIAQFIEGIWERLKSL
jgi:hypothetical protein